MCAQGHSSTSQALKQFFPNPLSQPLCPEWRRWLSSPFSWLWWTPVVEALQAGFAPPARPPWRARLRTRRVGAANDLHKPSERSCRRQYTEKRMMPTNTRMLTVSKVLIFLATAMNAVGWGLPHLRGIPVGLVDTGASAWPAASGTISHPSSRRAGVLKEGAAGRSCRQGCRRMLREGCAPLPPARERPFSTTRAFSAPLPPGFPRAGAARGRGRRALGILPRGARPPLRGRRGGLWGPEKRGRLGPAALGWCAAPARPAATAPVRSDAAAQLISMHAGPRARPSGPPLRDRPSGTTPTPPTRWGMRSGARSRLTNRVGGAGPRVQTQSKGASRRVRWGVERANNFLHTPPPQT